LTALEFFQRENIQCLPVDPMMIIREEKIQVLEYEKFSKIIQEPLQSIISEYGNDGFSTIINGKYTIIYNPNHTMGRTNWTLMHELSHIMLGHPEECGGIACRSSHRDKYDLQADSFTADVLAPLPILKLCEVDTAQKIKSITDISLQAAKIRLWELQNAHIKQEELDIYKKHFEFYFDWECYLADIAFDEDAQYMIKRYKARDTWHHSNHSRNQIHRRRH